MLKVTVFILRKVDVDFSRALLEWIMKKNTQSMLI